MRPRIEAVDALKAGAPAHDALAKRAPRGIKLVEHRARPRIQRARRVAQQELRELVELHRVGGRAVEEAQSAQLSQEPAQRWLAGAGLRGQVRAGARPALPQVGQTELG